jgi:hypothetical protein
VGGVDAGLFQELPNKFATLGAVIIKRAACGGAHVGELVI